MLRDGEWRQEQYSELIVMEGVITAKTVTNGDGMCTDGVKFREGGEGRDNTISSNFGDSNFRSTQTIFSLKVLNITTEYMKHKHMAHRKHIEHIRPVCFFLFWAGNSRQDTSLKSLSMLETAYKKKKSKKFSSMLEEKVCKE